MEPDVFAVINNCVLVLDNDSDFARISPSVLVFSAESYNPVASSNIFSFATIFFGKFTALKATALIGNTHSIDDNAKMIAIIFSS